MSRKYNIIGETVGVHSIFLSALLLSLFFTACTDSPTAEKDIPFAKSDYKSYDMHFQCNNASLHLEVEDETVLMLMKSGDLEEAFQLPLISENASERVFEEGRNTLRLRGNQAKFTRPDTNLLFCGKFSPEIWRTLPSGTDSKEYVAEVGGLSSAINGSCEEVKAHTIQMGKKVDKTREVKAWFVMDELLKMEVPAVSGDRDTYYFNDNKLILAVEGGSKLYLSPTDTSILHWLDKSGNAMTVDEGMAEQKRAAMKDDIFNKITMVRTLMGK